MMKARKTSLLVSLLLLAACKRRRAAEGGRWRHRDRRAARTGARAAGGPQRRLQRRLRAGRALAALERRAVEAGRGRTFVDKGELCLEVTNRGPNRWDAQLRHQHIKLQKGHTYTIQFKVRSSQTTRVYLKLGQAGRRSRSSGSCCSRSSDKQQTYSGTFTMAGARRSRRRDGVPHGRPAARLTPCRSRSASTTCASTIRNTSRSRSPVPPPMPDVLVNQVGYVPALAKIATVKRPDAVGWQLVNDKGQVVANGTTIPFGADAASGDQVSIADFTAYADKGTGYTLKVGNDVSHPFDIRDDIYTKLKYDALAFFYQQRSGIAIEMPYAGDAKWAHPAGHIGVKPNYGDNSVPCATGSGCSYALDVSGGWYDAGDHGKYVVNAGISVWTLLNYWERAQVFGSAAAFADGKVNIPENRNRVPDLLDEARWELEFELKMQVPEGEKLAGMAHHKIHDAKWTQLSLGPHEDPMPRFLQPPSTAATLNLAANAAQCARIWQTIDKAFAGKCLAAAERAWLAAKANPAIIAPNFGDGGGPYDDKNLKDDFYWAAAELFITTKKAEYKDAVIKADDFKKVTADWDDNPGMRTSMTWGDTHALGSISLAIVPNAIGKDVVDAIRKNIVAAADGYMELIQKQGYRLPFGVPKNGYPWGSNSFVVNNALVIALAHDISKDGKYLNGAVMGMDYVLGRNASDQSYVTGYGDRPLENPYHRFWCFQANPKYPPPPPGSCRAARTPASKIPTWRRRACSGCAPQKCFLDNGEAWSANEVTINWNAPLFWVAAYLDEKKRPRRRPQRQAA
jgi:endoglucanase